MVNQKIADFEEEVKSMGDALTDATISLYKSIVARFLPTPTRIHYLFNLRDISKVCILLLYFYLTFYGFCRCSELKNALDLSRPSQGKQIHY